MSKKYNSVEDLQAYISRLESSLKSYEDEHFNIQKSIDGCKSEINSIQLLQKNVRDDNFSKWQQIPNLDKQIEDVEANEPSLTDLIEGIDL